MGHPTPTSRVGTVMRAVDYDHYVTRPDGTRLPQSSAPTIIATMLTLLDPQPGNQVLKIGTGSGYSTALLAELVGDTGHVTSIDRWRHHNRPGWSTLRSAISRQRGGWSVRADRRSY